MGIDREIRNIVRIFKLRIMDRVRDVKNIMLIIDRSIPRKLEYGERYTELQETNSETSQKASEPLSIRESIETKTPIIDIDIVKILILYTLNPKTKKHPSIRNC